MIGGGKGFFPSKGERSSRGPLGLEVEAGGLELGVALGSVKWSTPTITTTDLGLRKWHR